MDDDNNLMSVQAGQPGAPGYVKAAYILNADRQTTGVAFSNGVIETDQLNNQGEVLSQSLQLAGTTLASDTFTYDAAGNRLTQVDNVGGTATTNQYRYDGAERLRSFSTSTEPAPLATSQQSVDIEMAADHAPAVPGRAILRALPRPSPAPCAAADGSVAAAPTPGGDSAATCTADGPRWRGPVVRPPPRPPKPVGGAPLFTASHATPPVPLRLAPRPLPCRHLRRQRLGPLRPVVRL